MTRPTPISEIGQGFYVPYFEVKVRDRDLPDDVIRDVMQVTYRDKVNEIDSFELMVNNWDAEARKLKYEPPVQQRYEHLFDPGQRLELRMGYVNALHLMVTGEITTLEPSYPESGGPTLSVRGLNVLHAFRGEQHTWSWDDRRDSDIAEWLGRRPVTRGQPGLGIRVETDPVPEERSETYVFMDNQFDIVFLRERARRHDYELVLREEERDGRREQYLYFGPSESRRQAPTYRLEWGKSLISFRPTLSTTRQISEVCVRGWDRRRKRRIEECARWQDLYPRRSPERSRMERLAQAFGNRREIITNRPVHTRAEARELAKRILQGQLKEMVQASGATVGLPDLRAGQKVEIVGLGPRFDGQYYITETTHTINDSGYRTTFSARREGPVQENAQ